MALLSVSGGTLAVNGNINNASGSTFAQSGGNINVDGNDAGATATSVASGYSKYSYRKRYAYRWNAYRNRSSCG
jgi:hypothetical protein